MGVGGEDSDEPGPLIASRADCEMSEIGELERTGAVNNQEGFMVDLAAE